MQCPAPPIRKVGASFGTGSRWLTVVKVLHVMNIPTPPERKTKGIKHRATVVYRQNGEVLFVRKRNAKWNLPGGRVEAHETPLQAALREMAEETGLALANLRFVAHHYEMGVIHYVFEAEFKEQAVPRPCNEIEACQWFRPEEISERDVRRPILALLQSQA